MVNSRTFTSTTSSINTVRTFAFSKVQVNFNIYTVTIGHLRPHSCSILMPDRCHSHSRTSPLGVPGWRAKMRKCAQGRNFAQGEALPKRDIVDTSFHASCAGGQLMTKQSVLPTSWGREQRARGAYWSAVSVGLQWIILETT